MYAPANAEFDTPVFSLPPGGAGARLWLNADASWSGAPVTGGCDEGCAAARGFLLLSPSLPASAQFLSIHANPAAAGWAI